MSKTALVDALKTFDLDKVRQILTEAPELKQLQLGKSTVREIASRKTDKRYFHALASSRATSNDIRAGE